MAPDLQAETGMTNILDGVINTTTNYYVGSNGAFNALVITNAGALRVVSGSGYIGNSAVSSNNTVLITGAGSTWSNANYLYVGYTGSFNQLTVADGGRLNSRDGYVSYTGSNNAVLVTGAGSVWSNSISLAVGGYGAFNGLTIADGGRVHSLNTYLGYGSSARSNTVLVTGLGSVWTNNNFLYVGQDGSYNSLVITNGGAVQGGSLTIGYSTTGSNNAVVVTGIGSEVSSRSDVTAGRAGSSNRLTIADGGRVFSTNGYVGNGVAFNYSSNNAALVTDAGSVWSNSSSFTVGNFGSGNSLVITNGGAVFNTYGAIGGGYTATLYVSSNNAVVVTGTGSVWRNSIQLNVGNTGSFNSLTITDGGQVSSRTGYVGYSYYAYTNVVVVTGAGSVWSNGSLLTVGSYGSGNRLVITNGGTVFNGIGMIGSNSSALNNAALVTDAGSVWSNSGGLTVGSYGSGNSLTITNGGWVFNSDGAIGSGASASNNAVAVTGSGSVWRNLSAITIGQGGVSNRLTVVGGGQVNAGGPIIVGSNATAYGNVLQVSGASSLGSAGLAVGMSGARSNSVSLLGGAVWNLGGGALVWGSGTGAFGNVLDIDATSAITNIFGLTLGESDRAFYMTNSADGMVLNGFTASQLQFSNNNLGGLVVGSGGSGTALVISNYSFNAVGLTIGASGGRTNSVTLVNNSTGNLGGGALVWGSGAGAYGNSLVVDSSSALTNIYGLTLGNNNTTYYMTNSAGGYVLNEFTTNQLEFAPADMGPLVVGQGGSNTTLVISNYALSTATGTIGNSANNNRVSIADSVWSNSGSLYVGRTGTNNSLAIASGGAVMAASVVVGYNPSTGNVLSVSGGTLYATNAAGTGALDVNYGALNLNSGTVTVDRLYVTNGANSTINLNGGTLNSGGAVVSNGSAFVTGDGVRVNLLGGTNLFANSVLIGRSGAASSLVVTNGAVARIVGSTVLGSNALANNNALLVAGAGSVWSNSGGQVVVGGYGSSNNMAVIGGGRVYSAGGYIGSNVSAAYNTVLVSGAGSLWTNTGSLYVGYNTGSFNQLTISQDGKVFANAAYVGYNAASSNNTVTVDDAGSLDMRSSDFYLGYDGQGNQLIVTNSGKVLTTYRTYIGNGATANNNLALVSGAGAVWTNSNDLYIGKAGSFNRLIINQGSKFIEGSSSYLGEAASSSNNVLWVEGPGSVWSNSGSYNWLYVGRNGSGNQLIITNGGSGYAYYQALGDASTSSNNLMVVSGSNSSWRTGYDFSIGNAGSGNQLTITNGGFVGGNQYSYIGYYASSSNNFVLVTGAGSVFSNSSGLYFRSGSNNKLITTNGGTIVGVVSVSGTNNTAILTGAGSKWTNSSVNVSGGASATIADGGRASGSSGSLSGNNNTLLVTDAGSRWDVSGEITVGSSGNSNSFIVANGAIVSQPTLNTFTRIGDYYGSGNNSAWVGGSGTLWTINGSLSVGDAGKSNSLTITDGGRVSMTGQTYVGNNGSNNIVVVNGTNSILTAGSGGAGIQVGNYGSDNLLILTNGGTLRANYANIGYGGGASNNLAIVTGAGSLWSNATDLRVGDSGSGNQLIITDGGKVITTNTTMGGYYGAGSNNGVTVSGTGSLLTNVANIVVGNYGPGNWMAINNGGSVSAGTGEYHALTIGNALGSSNNSVLVTGAGSSLVAPRITVGSQGKSNSLVIADSGLVRATNMVVGGYSGTNLLSVAGGNLYVTNATRSAALTVNGGTFQMNGGTAVVNRLIATTTSGLLDFKGGNLTLGGMTVSNGVSFLVGDGVQAAELDLLGLYTNQVSGGLTLADNATLSGVGNVNGNLTFQDGATFAPGHSAGTITNFGSVFFSDSSLLDYELGPAGIVGGGTNDLLVINGNLTLDGLLNVTSLGGFGTGTYTLITYTGTLINNGLDVGSLPFGTGSIQAGGGVVQLTVMPEPGAGALLALGLAAIAMRRRRGRKSPCEGECP